MATIYTNEVTLTVEVGGPSGPTIDTQPQDTTVDENTQASFSVAATSSGGALTYQWKKGGIDIGGATSDTYAFTAVLGDDQSVYSVEVSDDIGSVLSSNATLTVNDLKPTITQQPVATTVIEGEVATFQVVATSSGGNLSYQWRKDAVPITGEISPTLLFTTVLGDNGSSFDVVVTDDNGSETSSTALLTVDVTPLTLAGPESKTVVAGQSVTMAVTVLTGTPPYTYQWKRNGVDIVGAVSGQISFIVNQFNDGDQFTVEVTDTNKTVLSEIGTITVGQAPAPGPEDDVRTALIWNYEDNNYSWFDAAVDEGVALNNVPMMTYGFNPGWATRYNSAALAGLTYDDFKVALSPWNTQAAPRYLDMAGRGDEQNLFWLTSDGLWRSDQYVKTDGMKEYFAQRLQIDLDDLVQAWTTNNWKHTKQWYFHLQTPRIAVDTFNGFQMQIGWADTMMDDVGWQPPTTINLQKKRSGGGYKWDYRSSGRYLAIDMRFNQTLEIRYTGADVDVEQSHGR